MRRRRFLRVTALLFPLIVFLPFHMSNCHRIHMRGCYTVASLGQCAQGRPFLQPCQERGPDLRSKRIKDPSVDYRRTYIRTCRANSSSARSGYLSDIVEGLLCMYVFFACIFAGLWPSSGKMRRCERREYMHACKARW